MRLSPAVLSSPELTGKWEGRLDAISRGAEDSLLFIRDIKKMAADLVEEVKRSSLVYAPHFVNPKECPYCHGPMMKAVDAQGCVHHICQRLSCGYEEKEVRKKVASGASAQTRPVVGSDGKMRIVIKKSAVKVPKAVYETTTEVVRESKLAYRRSRDERRFDSRERHGSARSSDDDMSGGTFADFLRLSQERQKRDEGRKRRK